MRRSGPRRSGPRRIGPRRIGEKKRKNQQANQVTSRVTRPWGLVCKSGPATGYADDEQERRFAAKAIKRSTPLSSS